MTAAPARVKEPFSARRPLAFALGVAALVLALTADERVFGLLTDGQIMTRTSYAIAKLGEIGMAKGHPVNVARPAGDAVTRYGMAPSLVRAPVAAVAGAWEDAFGVASSQTLFVLEQLVLVLLAALAAGLFARALGGDARAARRAVLAAAIASPLWAYVSSDWSEPLQAACVGGAFAAAAWAVREEEERDPVNVKEREPAEAPVGSATPRRTWRLAALAGLLAGFALLSKSLLVVLFPAVVVALWGAAPGRVRRLVAVSLGFALPAAAWLAFEIARFGAPFASYAGERFSHPVLDGLWRLTLGVNKGLLWYFPLAALGVLGLVRLFPARRALALAVAGFSAFVLLTTSAWWSWDGTAGWGPRLLVPLLPLLAATAALQAAALPRAVFAALFAGGVAVNALGALQPDAVLTWYYAALKPRVLTAEEARAYPAFATEPDRAGGRHLIPIHDVANHAGLSPLRANLWLLGRRLAGGDVLASLRTPPWRTDVPGQEPGAPLEQAIPSSALVFLTSPFRWPHLGMSLTRGSAQSDTVAVFVDCVYDQALRAQDMRLGDRAVAFAEELFRRVPSAQTAATLAEAYRLAGRTETLREFVSALPREQKATPQYGMVLALAARDAGDAERARRIQAQVAAAFPAPTWTRLSEVPPSAWPATLREIEVPDHLQGRRIP